MIAVNNRDYVKRLGSKSLYPEKLTTLQIVQLQRLNKKLADIEGKLKIDILNLHLIAEERVEDALDWIEDYEIDIYITFTLKEDDYYYDEDLDNILVQLTEYPAKYLGITHISDGMNHSEFQHWDNHIMKKEHHCWLYHCLYDHTDLGWVDILRIGSIWVDINIEYQRVVDLI